MRLGDIEVAKQEDLPLKDCLLFNPKRNTL